MAHFEVIADGRFRVPDRDAYAVTVRVTRDAVDLGLWQTWISGMDEALVRGDVRAQITNAQCRRVAAELLARAVEAEARAGEIRTEWQLDVTVVPPTTAVEILAAARDWSTSIPEFQEGDVIRTFDA